MPILNVKVDQTGMAGVEPKFIYIDTNNTVAEVLAVGYLNPINQKFGIPLIEASMALVSTKTSVSATTTDVALFDVVKSGDNWSLEPAAGSGEVILPTVANRLAHFTNTTGTLSDAAADVVNLGDLTLGASGTEGLLNLFPTTALKGSLVVKAIPNTGNTSVTVSNAAHGQATVISIPDGGQATAEFIISDSASTQHITSGALQVDAGAISTGLAAGGFAGNVVLHANTTASGNLALLAVDNATGDFDTVVSNAAAVAQDQVVTIPDSGAATANFLLDTGAANILAKQQFIGLSDVLTFGTGTWTVTRIAQGNYVSRHTAADETSVIGIDITPAIRVAASKGFRLDSFDVIYSIETANMDAHTVTLDRVDYVNAATVTVTSIPVTGTLSIVDAGVTLPYVTNVAVDTPAFDVTADSKYVIEVTADNGATTEYDFYGIMLRFSETIG